MRGLGCEGNGCRLTSTVQNISHPVRTFNIHGSWIFSGVQNECDGGSLDPVLRVRPVLGTMCGFWYETFHNVVLQCIKSSLGGLFVDFANRLHDTIKKLALRRASRLYTTYILKV